MNIRYKKKIKCIVFMFSILVMTIGMFFVSELEAAAVQEPKQMIETFFTEEELQEEYFSPEILAELSLTELVEIRQDFTSGLGEFISADHVEGFVYNVLFEQGMIEQQFVLNQQGKISGLYFLSITEFESDLGSLQPEFDALSGRVSLLVTKNEEELLSLNPSQEMAVGSTFKIAVLKALQQEIDTGQMTWHDTISLEEKHKSLPSGQLHNWPAGSPLTLHTLAAKMISISDNTATDVLIDHLGRKKIEQTVTQNTPFLTTREFFVLKDPSNEELLEKYRSTEGDKKYDILTETKKHSLPTTDIFDQVRALDIEWFFSVYQLKELTAEVKDLDLMGINPELAGRGKWDKIAYKGGSEPGVLNFTYWLEEGGNEYFVSATWNDDKQLDNIKFIQLFQRLLGSLNSFY